MKRKLHPAFLMVAILSLLWTVFPLVTTLMMMHHVNLVAVLWLLWGGAWTLFWYLCALGRQA